MNTPQNLDKYPLTWSFSSQWEAIWSGSWFQRLAPTAKITMIKRTEIITVSLVDMRDILCGLVMKRGAQEHSSYTTKYAGNLIKSG
jgi:hypothetical protein